MELTTSTVPFLSMLSVRTTSLIQDKNPFPTISRIKKSRQNKTSIVKKKKLPKITLEVPRLDFMRNPSLTLLICISGSREAYARPNVRQRLSGTEVLGRGGDKRKDKNVQKTAPSASANFSPSKKHLCHDKRLVAARGSGNAYISFFNAFG